MTTARAEDMRRQAREVLSEIFSLANAQVAVALVVAFLGVLNTLWISVVLRRREMGLLRSVGATRGQVARAIVVEAAALGVVTSAIADWFPARVVARTPLADALAYE